MFVRTLQFLSIILIAIYMVPQAAHLIELPAKMTFDRDAYFTAQQIYAGWSLSAVPLFGALVATLALAFFSRGQRLSMSLGATAFLLMLAVLIVFFLRVAPMNTVTGQWTTVPSNWEAVRAQWEYGHAVNAVITFVALVCTTLSALAWKPERPAQITS